MSEEDAQQIIELSFVGINIQFSRNNPETSTFLKLHCESNKHSYLVGETENVKNQSSPVYSRHIRIDYLSYSSQILKVQLWESSKGSNSMLGDSQIFLKQVIQTESSSKIPIISSEGTLKGEVLISWSKVKIDKSAYCITINCLNVKNTDIFGKIDPFVKLYRPYDSHVTYNDHESIPDSLWCLVYQTEVAKSDLNPKYGSFVISNWNLNRGNPNVLIKAEIWSHSVIGRHKMIGCSQTALSKVLSGPDRFLNTFDKKGKYSGTVSFVKFDQKRSLTLKEHKESGVSVRVFFAVNCSTSMEVFNKKKEVSPGSENSDTEIGKAIKTLEKVLSSISSGGRIGFLGFSALLNGCSSTSFSFNGNIRNPAISSPESALDLYDSLYKNLVPSKPTRIEPLIERMRLMVKYQDRNKKKVYTVLVVLTDGDINDQLKCVDRLVETSLDPVSILFVGIGKTDFSKIEYLETGIERRSTHATNKQTTQRDLSRLKDSKGKQGCRSIVKFVLYQNYAEKPKELEEAIVRELSRQMNEYYNAEKVTLSPQVNSSNSSDSSPTKI